MSAWVFPTSTCEAPIDDFPRQPWSALVNVIIIGMMMCRKRTPLVLSVVLFELVHLWSHTVYRPGLAVLQHFTVYPVLHYYARPGRWTRHAKLADCLVVAFVGGIWQIYSSVALLLTHNVQDRRVKLAVLVAVMLLANEQANCVHMLEHASLPYHVVTELALMYVLHCITKSSIRRK